MKIALKKDSTASRKTLGSVIDDVLKRIDQKAQDKNHYQHTVKIIYKQKDISSKGKKTTYHVFALEVEGKSKVVSKIKTLGGWSGIGEYSGKTTIEYAAKGKAGKETSRQKVFDTLKSLQKTKNDAITIGIGKTIDTEDKNYFEREFGKVTSEKSVSLKLNSLFSPKITEH